MGTMLKRGLRESVKEGRELQETEFRMTSNELAFASELAIWLCSYPLPKKWHSILSML